MLWTEYEVVDPTAPAVPLVKIELVALCVRGNPLVREKLGAVEGEPLVREKLATLDEDWLLLLLLLVFEVATPVVLVVFDVTSAAVDRFQLAFSMRWRSTSLRFCCWLL